MGDKKADGAVASTIRAKLQLVEFGFEDKKPVPTFKEYSEKWIEGYVKINLRESTFDEYESVLRNHVLPAFKGQRIDLLDSQHSKTPHTHPVEIEKPQPVKITANSM